MQDRPIAQLNAFRQEETVDEKNENGFLATLHDLAFLIAAVLIVFSLLFRVVIVSGPSMKMTLVDGDWLILLGNVLYGEPKQGDVIVASKDSFDDGAPIVKRVIATEGQTVDIDFNLGVVYVDGVALSEEYINGPTTLFEGVQFPLVVDEGCVFVLGDNRGVSKDSRSPDIGLIDEREILGRAIFLVVPGNEGGLISRDFSRIGVIS